MYFKKNNSFAHGIMFHHFHDNKKHIKQQGSISEDEFYKIIKFIGRENIIDAKDFYKLFINKENHKKKVCFTFDDSLLCQFDIAFPILNDLKIKSFFFIYSSLYDGKPDMLEIYRYFRMNFFQDIDEFYEIFFKKFNEIINYFNLNEFDKFHTDDFNKLKNKAPYLSSNDTKFRVIRDEILKKEDYSKIMDALFKDYEFDYRSIMKKLFISKEQLKFINQFDHEIGLHSHRHPTSMQKLSYDEQLLEYSENKKIIESIIEENIIFSMSHPNGNYNRNTLEILRNLDITLGFKPNMVFEEPLYKDNNSFLEVARENHTNIMKLINR